MTNTISLVESPRAVLSGVETLGASHLESPRVSTPGAHVGGSKFWGPPKLKGHKTAVHRI